MLTNLTAIINQGENSVDLISLVGQGGRARDQRNCLPLAGIVWSALGSEIERTRFANVVQRPCLPGQRRVPACWRSPDPAQKRTRTAPASHSCRPQATYSAAGIVQVQECHDVGKVLLGLYRRDV